MTPDHELSLRELAILRAVASGRAEITCSSEPDLFIDGLPCCDQYTAHGLAHRALIVPARPGPVGHRVQARLTAAAAGIMGEAA
ncbi:hypothetical protein [Amycolatopsis regifaucium]|uniref:HTH luxR-type domain-containing protein n=1 Tax=Amycolatopsis regifaucium TaxID=546365 RepID=A0A154MFA0_9PSEU|nr:hypothetical protein [Amycolatopsis regifaucium]KZB83155.1 hypothetical protein AVL48_36685 [Amycolatopsis regifaucium]OKA03193.1 hypothetical protein ATP06_0237315 [Amycolatopsis regifaucium]SFJ47744.1 hypothetical protein SAMN04489731_12257 [Amycolatopsis regifaucium]